MDIEQAFNVAGEFGRYQSLCYLFIAGFNQIAAWQTLLIVIIGATPEKTTSNRGKVTGLHIETIVSEWDLYNNLKIPGYIQSVFMIGVLTGNLLAGKLSDTYGRKTVVFRAYTLLIFTSFLSTFANNYIILAGIRYFVGVFCGSTVLVSFVHGQEILGASVWTFSGTLVSFFFSVGVMTLAGIGSVTPDWRNVCLITSLPGIVFCLGYFVLPESPRWLYSQGRVSEAENVLKKIARYNGKSESSYRSLALQPKPESKKLGKSYGISDIFTSAILKARFIAMGYLWFAISFSYYGVMLNASNVHPNLYASTALLGLIEIPACLFTGIVMKKTWAGRKRTLIFSAILGAVSCFAVMFTSDGSTTRLTLALIGKFAFTSCFNTIYIYASELFPTVLRNVAMGGNSVCARIGGILAPSVPVLDNYIPSSSFIVFSVASALCVIATLRLPETLNRPVPDTVEELEQNQHSYEKLYNDDNDDESDDDENTELYSKKMTEV